MMSDTAAVGNRNANDTDQAHMTMTTPSGILRDRPMSARQYGIVAICVTLNMLDGFDILVIAFAAPVIKSAWTLSPQQVGLILSASLAGMTVGALTLPSIADFHGRRRTILLCLSLSTAGMLLGACASGLNELLTARFVTGLGVGGMMPTINTLVAEYTSDRQRNRAIVLQAAGYPLGGALGGLLAIGIVESAGWKPLLLTGAAISLAMFPIVLRWLPESIEYLLERRPPRALALINATLNQLRMPPLDALPPPSSASRQGVGLRALLGPALISSAIVLSTVMFLVQFCFYFLMSWTPTLLANAGLSASAGVRGAILMNVGGIIGDLVFAVLCMRYAPRILGAVCMGCCFLGAVALATLPREIQFTLHCSPAAFFSHPWQVCMQWRLASFRRWRALLPPGWL